MDNELASLAGLRKLSRNEVTRRLLYHDKAGTLKAQMEKYLPEYIDSNGKLKMFYLGNELNLWQETK